MLSLPVCKPRNRPERSLDENQTETRLMLSLAGLHGSPLVVPGMFDSETVAFVSGECNASSMKVAFFHRSSSAPASCAEIELFPQFQPCVRVAFSGSAARIRACFRRVTIDLAGICKGKLEIGQNQPGEWEECYF